MKKLTSCLVGFFLTLAYIYAGPTLSDLPDDLKVIVGSYLVDDGEILDLGGLHGVVYSCKANEAWLSAVLSKSKVRLTPFQLSEIPENLAKQITHLVLTDERKEISQKRKDFKGFSDSQKTQYETLSKELGIGLNDLALKSIAKFSNLEHLDVKLSNIRSLDFLKDLKQITSLKLDHLLEIPSSCYFVLGDLPLKSLTIRPAIHLRDLSFFGANGVYSVLSENLEFLSISGYGLSHLKGLEFCKKLDKLELRHVRVQPNAFKALSELKLNTLKLNYCNVDSLSFLLENAKASELALSLKSLELESCALISLEEISACIHLQKLQLNQPLAARVKSTSWYFLSNLSELQELTIDSTDFPDFTMLACLTELTKLKLENHCILESIKGIENLKKLKILELEHAYNVPNYEFNSLRELTDLEVLSVPNSKISVDDVLPLKKLKELNSTYCNNFSRTDYALFGGQNLKVLHIDHGEKGNLVWAKNFPRLEKLFCGDEQIPLSDINRISLDGLSLGEINEIEIDENIFRFKLIPSDVIKQNAMCIGVYAVVNGNYILICTFLPIDYSVQISLSKYPYQKFAVVALGINKSTSDIDLIGW